MRRGGRCRRRTKAMKFDQRTTREMIQTIADTVIGSTDELTELDRAIGDADHGVNLERGFNAVLAKIDSISAQPIDAALSEVGKTLILSVGGASGPQTRARSGRRNDTDDCASRPRVVPRRTKSRSHGPGRTIVRIDRRGSLRFSGDATVTWNRGTRWQRMLASSSCRTRPTWRRARPTWCVRWSARTYRSRGAVAIRAEVAAGDMAGAQRAGGGACGPSGGLGGRPDRAPHELARLLAETGVRPIASHEGIERLRGDPAAVAGRLDALGCDRAVVPWMPEV